MSILIKIRTADKNNDHQTEQSCFVRDKTSHDLMRLLQWIVDIK